ncbi:MAG: sodium:solute symporter family protein [Phycisphaerae bacterium]
MLAQAVEAVDIVVIVLYLMVVGYLGYLGFSRTKSATDYLVAGRKINPFIMAMSYGATFISTSAIVGFGGVAGMFGMSLLWLTFLNIFVGIFVAFVFLAGPTRHMGHRLDAHTFPELLGRRYNSKFVQIFGGLVIFLFIPLYAAAVLIAGCEFIATKFAMDYNVALMIFGVIIAAYVVIGGLKGVMYTDALQGSLMFLGMIILLIGTYAMLGGVTEAHQALTDSADKVFVGHQGLGHQGWTATPTFGFTGTEEKPAGHYLWWIVFSTIVLGVGIGVMAQPQLCVRFMTVSSKKQLNRAVLVGGIFILIMTGVAFTVGALSNLYFLEHETITGTIVDETEENVIAKKERGIESRLPCRLLHIDVDGDGKADRIVVGEGIGKVAAIMPKAEVTELEDGRVEVKPRSSSFTRALIRRDDGDYEFNSDSIIPAFITSAMPKWFSTLFMLTLLAAAMSTLSSQFHTLGTSIGRDVFEQSTGRHGRSVGVTRLGIIVGIIIAVILSYYARGGYIVARATAIFFGLCASAFLPSFIGGLFSKRVTKPAAVSSMVVGFVVTAFWLVFIKDKEARAINICNALFGSKEKPMYSLLEGTTWSQVDPLVVALPLSALVFIVVTLITKPPAREHLAKCFHSVAQKV